MGHPVTTNPLIIMLINMTIVFAVLIGLSFMIRLIHLVDPTKAKEEEPAAPDEPVIVPDVPEGQTEPAPVVKTPAPEIKKPVIDKIEN